MQHFLFFTGPLIVILGLIIPDPAFWLLLLGFEAYSLGWHQRIHHRDSALAHPFVRTLGLMAAWLGVYWFAKRNGLTYYWAAWIK